MLHNVSLGQLTRKDSQSKQKSNVASVIDIAIAFHIFVKLMTQTHSFMCCWQDVLTALF